MQKFLFIAVWPGLLLFTVACSSISLDEMFAKTKEIDRVRYFDEINLKEEIRTEYGLTGKGVRVTIMGEIVDSTHPDLQNRIVKQYNSLYRKGKILTGEGNQAYGYEKFGDDDGHGTHVAGTVAAECDGKGLQGVACEATLDVYDFGTYDNKNLIREDYKGEMSFPLFMEGFRYAVEDVTKRKESRILTGSFNFQSPVIFYRDNNSLKGKMVEEIQKKIGDNTLSKLKNMDIITPENPADWDFLTEMIKRYEIDCKSDCEDDRLFLGTLIPLSSEWDELATAIGEYQKTDGVYLVTESNYVFDGRTSVLNAMPSLTDKVDKDLWLSIVLVAPEGLKEAFDSEEGPSDEELDRMLAEKKYTNPLNSCGDVAFEYCILVPSYMILSTVTKKLSSEDEEFYTIDDRGYQIYTGHSMGAPMVAAALALMEEYNVREKKGYTMKDLVRILKKNADRSFQTYDPKLHGQGVLDIKSAIDAM